MTRRPAIAVAQTCPVDGDVAANLAAHLQLVSLAAQYGARVVVFPELSLTGYEIERAPQLAFAERDSRLRPLEQAAAAHGLTVLAGAPVRMGARLQIGAFVLSPDGTHALYTKHRLGAFGESARVDGVVPPAEATVFAPGDRDPLIRIDSGTAAIAICADIGDPRHAQRAADRGADAYLASMFVIPSDFDQDMARLSRYAAQHAIVVALANFGAATGGLSAAGRSAIWNERGERLVQLDARGAGVAVAVETASGWRTYSAMAGEPRPAA